MKPYCIRDCQYFLCLHVVGLLRFWPLQNTSTAKLCGRGKSKKGLWQIFLSYTHHVTLSSCLRPYHVENTSSRPITEVKQHWALLVLGWETAWEHRVLLAFLFWFSSQLSTCNMMIMAGNFKIFRFNWFESCKPSLILAFLEDFLLQNDFQKEVKKTKK